MASDARTQLATFPGAGKVGVENVGFEVVARDVNATKIKAFAPAEFGSSDEDVKTASLYVTRNGGPRG